MTRSHRLTHIAMATSWMNFDDSDESLDMTTMASAPKKMRTTQFKQAPSVVQAGDDSTDGPTTWMQRLRDAYRTVVGPLGKQAKQIIVDSACTGMATHAVALQACSHLWGSGAVREIRATS